MSQIPYHGAESGRWGLLHGHATDALKLFGPNTFDSVVTDPPYELAFMGKVWDGTGIAFDMEFWRGVLRVLKPGAHLLAFGGTRTYHRMTCAIEDAGFEIRDSLHWFYGTGFPKSLNVSLTMDKQVRGRPQGTADPEKRGKGKTPERNALAMGGGSGKAASGLTNAYDAYVPVTDFAKQWEGWGTALKPGHEPIVLARKPLEGTVAANVQKWGTGALNIDASRIATSDNLGGGAYADAPTERPKGRVVGADRENPDTSFKRGGAGAFVQPAGRWPANVLLDEDAAAELDGQSGSVGALAPVRGTEPSVCASGAITNFRARPKTATPCHGDSGGASRFFYVAKPGRSERDSAGPNAHPTVKPVTLMRYLVWLVTPPGGAVLDPFTGSGTTGMATLAEGMRFVGVEREAAYVPLAFSRIAAAEKERNK